jgi:hypothetical protein
MDEYVDIKKSEKWSKNDLNGIKILRKVFIPGQMSRGISGSYLFESKEA